MDRDHVELTSRAVANLAGLHARGSRLQFDMAAHRRTVMAGGAIERIGSVVEMTYPELQDRSCWYYQLVTVRSLLHRFQGRFKQGLGIG